MSIGLTSAVALIATASAPDPAVSEPTTSAKTELVSAEAAKAPPPLQWSDGTFYFVMGVAPGATFHLDGFNALVRYDAQLGMRWHRGKAHISVGAEPWILQRLEAPGAGGGLHGVVTAGRGPVYARLGAGVLAGIAGSKDDRDARASLSALGGIGLESNGEHVRGRIGVDYTLTVDESGRVNNTVFLALRIRFG